MREAFLECPIPEHPDVEIVSLSRVLPKGLRQGRDGPFDASWAGLEPYGYPEGYISWDHRIPFAWYAHDPLP